MKRITQKAMCVMIQSEALLSEIQNEQSVIDTLFQLASDEAQTVHAKLDRSCSKPASPHDAGDREGLMDHLTELVTCIMRTRRLAEDADQVWLVLSTCCLDVMPVDAVTAALDIAQDIIRKTQLFVDNPQYKEFAPKLIDQLVMLAHHSSQQVRNKARATAQMLLTESKTNSDAFAEVICFAVHAMFKHVNETLDVMSENPEICETPGGSIRHSHHAMDIKLDKATEQRTDGVILMLDIVSDALQMNEYSTYAIVKCRSIKGNKLRKMWTDEQQICDHAPQRENLLADRISSSVVREPKEVSPDSLPDLICAVCMCVISESVFMSVSKSVCMSVSKSVTLPACLPAAIRAPSRPTYFHVRTPHSGHCAE